MKLIPYTIHSNGLLEFKTPDGCTQSHQSQSYEYMAFIMLQLEAGNLPWYIHPAVWHYEVPIIDGSHLTDD